MGQLGKVLRGYRRREGLTQQELADLAGLSLAGLRDVEQGRVRTPRPGTLRRLGAALTLSATETDALLHIGLSSDRTAAGLSVEILGPLRVTVAGEQVDLGSESQRALLGTLALAPNQPVSRHELCYALWGDAPPPTAAEILQSRMSRLRRRLQPGDGAAGQVITTHNGGYQLCVDEGLDLLRFRQLVAGAQRARQVGNSDIAADLYRDAVALWHGDPLVDLAMLHDHPEVLALRTQRVAVVVEYGAVTAELGRYAEALPALWQLAVADPLHEALHAAVMIALAGSGQQAAALDVFDSLRGRLADELGADPGSELAEAHRRVLRQDLTHPRTAQAGAHHMPLAVANFTGRERQSRMLRGWLPTGTASGGTAVVIISLEGMAGVGKTSLAVHFAHQLLAAGRYPDEQLYADLRGNSAEPPADPADVLGSFLRLLGVPDDQVPPDLDARAALYRDRLSGRKAIVLLDNVADERQVLPLLPASAESLLLITSRRSLALDGAHTHVVDVLPSDAAVSLLGHEVGRDRVEAEPEAAREVVGACGRLPLAVALAGRRLRSQPTWRVADLAERLRDAGDRLGQLAVGTRQLTAVFELSYRPLGGPAKRMFGLLGLHPGAGFTAESVAALMEQRPCQCRALLDHLVNEHLATMAAGGRYTMHGLLRDYARAVVRLEESEQSRRAAMERLMDFYVHAVAHALEFIRPGWSRGALPGRVPAFLPAFATAEDARRWLVAERASLLSMVTLAAPGGWPDHAWQLASDLRDCSAEWAHVYPTATLCTDTSSTYDGVQRCHVAGLLNLLGRPDEAAEHRRWAHDGSAS